jgi:hypothetical protein
MPRAHSFDVEAIRKRRDNLTSCNTGYPAVTVRWSIRGCEWGFSFHDYARFVAWAIVRRCIPCCRDATATGQRSHLNPLLLN